MNKLTVIEGGKAKWERESRAARLEAHPDQHNAHVKDFKSQPGYFENIFLPKLMARPGPPNRGA
jgi:hypothetical protein